MLARLARHEGFCASKLDALREHNERAKRRAWIPRLVGLLASK